MHHRRCNLQRRCRIFRQHRVLKDKDLKDKALKDKAPKDNKLSQHPRRPQPTSLPRGTSHRPQIKSLLVHLLRSTSKQFLKVALQSRAPTRRKNFSESEAM